MKSKTDNVNGCYYQPAIIPVMNLPHAHLAIVEQEKVTQYLMNSAHPDNGGKAAFFASLGFSGGAWQTLVSALLAIASSFPVTKSMESTHGIKYIVDGIIQGPIGLSGTVRTIWIIDSGRDRPRLVTAYPQKGSL